MLVCSTNTKNGPYSFLVQLYGDPDDYVYKMGNDTYARRLPIRTDYLSVRQFDVFHSMSIDSRTQEIYYGNNAHEQLEYGLFVYNNETTNYYFPHAPETNQVTEIQTLLLLLLLLGFIKGTYIAHFRYAPNALESWTRSRDFSGSRCSRYQ